jgi:hypothetical protein
MRDERGIHHPIPIAPMLALKKSSRPYEDDAMIDHVPTLTPPTLRRPQLCPIRHRSHTICPACSQALDRANRGRQRVVERLADAEAGG